VVGHTYKEGCLNLLYRISLIYTLLLFGAYPTLACSCVQNPLEKRFREAKAVFIGRAISNDLQDKSLIQNVANSDKYSQVLEVVKAFKGVKKNFINVTFDEESLRKAGMCPTLYYFEENREYLIFAYSEKYEVKSVCSDTWEIPSDRKAPSYDLMQSYVKKLGSFWFRFRAKFHPF
jgi:hypothetical protein